MRYRKVDNLYKARARDQGSQKRVGVWSVCEVDGINPSRPHAATQHLRTRVEGLFHHEHDQRVRGVGGSWWSEVSGDVTRLKQLHDRANDGCKIEFSKWSAPGVERGIQVPKKESMINQ